MKLIFLGTGSAFTLGANNYHSNMILESNAGKKLLIDCGSDARFSLHEQGYSYRDIESVYISHFHADHSGGLEWLALSTKMDPHCKKPNLYISEELVDGLWNKSLAAGLSTIQGVISSLDTFFSVKSIASNGFFVWDKINFTIIQTIHILNGFSLVPSFGLMFKVNNINVFITTDTQFVPHQFEDIYQKSDLIFQDCEILEKKSGVHAHYSELKTLPKDIKAKMWLYHYNPVALPNAKQDGFLGFVNKGQLFDFNDKATLYK